MQCHFKLLTMVSGYIRAFSQKTLNIIFMKEWDTLRYACTQVAQVLVPSKGDMCLKASDMETKTLNIIFLKEGSHEMGYFRICIRSDCSGSCAVKRRFVHINQ